jgi:glutathione S-transferase
LYIFYRYDTGLKKPNRRIEKLDEILSKQEFLVDGIFTVGDVAVASYIAYVLQFFPGVDLSRWPNVVRYVKDCVSRDAYAQAFGPQVQGVLTRALDEMGQPDDEPSSKKLFGMF